MKRSESHTTDLLFTLGLFCVFAASAMILVMIGIRAYQTTVGQMQDTFSTRTAVSYVAEKLRQHDASGAVALTELEGETALCLSDTVEGNDYRTYIYADGEALYELTVHADAEPKRELGEKIIDVADFSIEDAGDGFFSFSATGSGGDTVRVLLHLMSEAADGGEG